MSFRFRKAPRGSRRRCPLLTVSGGVAVSAALFLQVSPAHAAREYTVSVDGNPVTFEGVGPVQVSGRVLVPLRGVLESTGAAVRWDPEGKVIHAQKDGTALQLGLGQQTALVNGQQTPLDVPAMVMRGTTMVPLRFVVEALGARVTERAGKINIATKPVAAAKLASTAKPGATAPKTSATRSASASKPLLTPFPRQVARPQVETAAANVPATQPSAPAKTPVVATATRVAAARPVPTATAARQTLTGIAEAVKADAIPPMISVLAEGKSAEYALAPAAVVLSRQGETGTARESALREICPGDRVMAKVDATGKITILVFQFDQVEGEAASVDADAVVLKDGTRVPFADTTQVVLADGSVGAKADLRAGDSMRIRMRPDARIATVVTVTQAGVSAPVVAAPAEPTPAAQPAPTPVAPVQVAPGPVVDPAPAPVTVAVTEETPAPVSVTTPVAIVPNLKVTSFTHNADGALRAGSVLTVTLEGEKDAVATFSMGKVAPSLAMQEVAPGKYVGTYTVAEGLNERVSIFGKLTREGRESPLVQAGTPVHLDSVPAVISERSPAEESTVADSQSVIYAVYADDNGSGVDAERVRLLVAGEDVTNHATRTSRFIAYRPVHPFANGPVPVRLLVQDRAGNQTEATWQFTVNAPELTIKSVTHNATRPIGDGGAVTVTVLGKPHGKATFDIGTLKTDLPMVETAPGTYQGRYVAEKGDLALYARIVAHMTNEAGERASRECSEPITILTVPPKAPQISAPAAGDTVEEPIVVKGKAQPNVTVRVQVERTVRHLNLWADKSVVAVQDVKVDSDGSFATGKLSLPRARSGETLTIQCVASDPADQQSEPAVVRVKLR